MKSSRNFGGTLSQMLGLSPADGDSNMYLRTYWSSLKTASLPPDLPFARLSDGLCHFACQTGLPERPAAGDYAAFLDFLPTACFTLGWGCLLLNGIINHLLIKYGIINEPLNMFYNAFSLQLVMVYAYPAVY